MADNNGSNAMDIEKRADLLEECIDGIESKYLQDIDIPDSEKLAENNRRETTLDVLDKLLFPKKDKAIDFLLQKAKAKKHLTKAEVAKVREYEMKLLLKGLDGNKKPYQCFGDDIWYVSGGALLPREKCPLHDNEALDVFMTDTKVYVEWLRDVSRYCLAFPLLILKDVNELFGELKGQLTIMNPTFQEFVINTPYRHIAAEMLGTAVFGISSRIKDTSKALTDFVNLMEAEVTRYDNGFTDADVFIMRTMAMLDDAIVNSGLKEAWTERTVD